MKTPAWEIFLGTDGQRRGLLVVLCSRLAERPEPVGWHMSRFIKVIDTVCML